jgi:hypothetical protein
MGNCALQADAKCTLRLDPLAWDNLARSGSTKGKGCPLPARRMPAWESRLQLPVSTPRLGRPFEHAAGVQRPLLDSCRLDHATASCGVPVQRQCADTPSSASRERQLTARLEETGQVEETACSLPSWWEANGPGLMQWTLCVGLGRQGLQCAPTEASAAPFHRRLAPRHQLPAYATRDSGPRGAPKGAKPIVRRLALRRAALQEVPGTWRVSPVAGAKKYRGQVSPFSSVPPATSTLPPFLSLSCSMSKSFFRR